MRERTTVIGGFPGVASIEYAHDSDPSNWLPYGSYSTGERITKSIVDTDTPTFRKILECGGFLPINPVIISTITEERIAGAVNCHLDGAGGITYRGQSWNNNFVIPPGFIPTPNEALTEAAVLAAASACIDQAWDVLTFLAQFKQSVDTMASVAGRFNKTSLQLASRAVKNARKNPGAVYRLFREYWLEARYGIRPMMYDYYDAANFVSKLLSNASSNLVTGRGTQSEILNDTEGSWQDFDATWENKDQIQVTGSYTHRGVAYMSPSRLQKVGLNANVLTTLHEQLPYSFVVDWFINIGAWVKTLPPQLTGQYEGIGESLKIDRTFTGNRTYRVKPGQGSGTWDNGQHILKVVEYRRLPSGVSFPSVLPTLTLPKVADLVALFVSGRKAVDRTLSVY